MKRDKSTKGKFRGKNIFVKAKPISDESEDESEVGNARERFTQKKWYEDIDIHPNTTTEMAFEEVEKFRREAKSLLDEATTLNSKKPPKSVPQTDFEWMKTVMAKGTKSDKIAAYVLLIQDSPLYNLHLLSNIIGMVKVGKKEWTLAAESLQELFLNDLLPPDQKLRLFGQQPLKELNTISSGNDGKRKNLLMLWYFENQLKLGYRDFIVALNQIAHDSVDANKEKAISVMTKLLEGNPEQESALLSNIVNKLGDPSHKVGSKVIYSLTKLLQTHPNMREVVMDEVEKLLFRPNIGKRAQYYGVCFLTQFCLSKNDAKLARKLIFVYLSLFKACIKTGEIDSRMMSALLTGVNRAYPYAEEDTNILQEQINTIYKVVHFGKPNVAIQALSLLHLMSGDSGSDRFYMVLYKKIAEPPLYNSTHHAMFLSLIFKALKKDKRPERISAFLKRLLQVAAYLPAPIVCGLLFIVSEIISRKSHVLHLEHKAMESDEPKTYNSDDDDDADEHYQDVDEEEKTNEDENILYEVKSFPPLGESDAPEENKANGKENVSEQLKVWRNPWVAPEDRNRNISVYDPYHRNPLYAGGSKTVMVELNKLANHYHPSVSLFATNILNGERIKYSGDPLQDFALIRFLDKFSFKNPKTLKEQEERKDTFSTFGRRKMYSQLIMTTLMAKKEDYLKRHERNVPVDEKFIFNYLKEKESRIAAKKEEEESDVESVDSDEFEEIVGKMTGMKDEDIDFLNEAGQLPAKGKKGVKEGEVDEEDSEADEEPDMSDGEGSFAEDFDGDETDENLSDAIMEGSEIDESELPPSLMHLSGPPKGRGKSKGPEKFSKEKLFASAEEFSELLEQTDRLAGRSEAVSNRENAGKKQLKWEADRYQKFSRNHGKGSRQNPNAKKGLKRQKFGGKPNKKAKRRKV
ncbi:UNVERIFIED_CONTAM: hypothetical protein PYX00_006702 [Menopon gallinae]|uniref:CCAAT-binding factor domain-containing protein n=1 Tax=Menopon gallinae TaxID=328185 RepID=A0AAW2HX20_9NEOP